MSKWARDTFVQFSRGERLCWWEAGICWRVVYQFVVPAAARPPLGKEQVAREENYGINCPHGPLFALFYTRHRRNEALGRERGGEKGFGQ
eukprot:1323541-Amorphochlora_amoeboformis.AAC.1